MLIGAFVLLALVVTFVPVVLVCGLSWGRWPRSWKRVLVVHLILVPVHAFVTFPMALGYVGSRWVDTRGDERAYEGPWIGDDGTWWIQDRGTLRDPGPRSNVERVSFGTADGLEVGGWLVPPADGKPVATVVLVHGLFRRAMEVEPVAAVFRDLGAEVFLLELRNHGDSGRAPFTFGLRERNDVLAAVEWLRARDGVPDRPLVLYGVSLGTAAVALAAPRVEGLDAVVLDAPMADLLATAHRMLGKTRNRGRRVIATPEPFRSLVLRAVELWSGFEMERVQPGETLGELPAEVVVLLIGGGRDDRMPPDVVRAIFANLPQPASRRRLWIEEEAGHGKVWSQAPQDYRAHLEWVVGRVRGG